MNSKELLKLFGIVRRFTKLYAGEGDGIQARQAVADIAPIAEQGNVEAQYILGQYYSWGYHSDCDNLKAIYWYEKAADNDNEQAAEAIMNIYRNDCPDGIDVGQRKSLILEWHKRWFDILAGKAEKGSANAAKALMTLYVEDSPEDMEQKDCMERAAKWYDRWIGMLTVKAVKGDFVDKMNLADILLYADGIPEEVLDCFSDEDDERGLLQAIKLYKEIAESDCGEPFKSEAYYKMGCAYNDLRDGKNAFACFKKAAKLNGHEAYAKIGDAYRYGIGTGQDDAQARKWYRKGADVGEITAILKLADCYKNGIGGERDYDKAMIEYQHIAERTGQRWKHQVAGIGMALYELGNMYLNGLGVQSNLKKAYRYFKLAAKKENHDAENALNDERFKDFK